MKRALMVDFVGFAYGGADWEQSRDLFHMLLGAMQRQGVSSPCSIGTSSFEKVKEFVPGAIERNKVDIAFLIFENDRERGVSLLETSQKLLGLLPETMRLIVFYINGEGAGEPEEETLQQLREAGCEIINEDYLLSGKPLPL